jgi:exonuclease III
LGADLYKDVPAKLHALCRTWIHRKLDIVCLQETWITESKIPFAEFNLNRASQLLGGGDWVAFWAPALTAHSCGVAILIRSALLSSGILQVGPPTPHFTGRLLTLPLSWGSHSFTCVATYVPSGVQRLQREFITNTLIAVTALPGDKIYFGDFNFVHNPHLDCLHGSHHLDGPVADHFNNICPHLNDTFRALHPQTRGFTRVAVTTAA